MNGENRTDCSLFRSDTTRDQIVFPAYAAPGEDCDNLICSGEGQLGEGPRTLQGSSQPQASNLIGIVSKGAQMVTPLFHLFTSVNASVERRSHHASKRRKWCVKKNFFQHIANTRTPGETTIGGRSLGGNVPKPCPKGLRRWTEKRRTTSRKKYRGASV